jgi:hypothetical protein
MPPADDLYDRDFFLWTQAQADALRAAGKGQRGSNSVEWERVAEEVEDLGKSDVDAAMSLMVTALEHLFKLAASGRPEPHGHWRKEVRAARGNLKRKLSPTIRAKVQADLEALHVEAAALAADAFSSEEPQTAIPLERRWTLAEVLGEENDPIA